MTKEEAIAYIREWLKDEYALNSRDRKALNTAIKALEQEPKTGYWINKSKQSGCGVNFIRIECSECGEPSGLNNTYARYCPWCGAKMIEPQESEGV